MVLTYLCRKSPRMRQVLFGLFAVCMLVSNSARAISGSTDYTGLWWNASESGWGMNIIQQEQILFITLFIYGAGNAPTWYVASNVRFSGVNAAGDRTYTGELYATTGTPFGTVPFVPSAVTVTQPGNITFVGKADGTATLQYNVGTTTVNKTLTRQTWAQPNNTLNVATPYAATGYSTTTGCANPADNGSGELPYLPDAAGTRFSLYVNGSAMSMTLRPPASENLGTCTFSGSNYVQEGRFGRATLVGRCSTQPASWTNITWNIRELEVGQNFFNMQYTNAGGPSASCRDTGVFTGARLPQ